jgi:hypothetical protein
MRDELASLLNRKNLTREEIERRRDLAHEQIREDRAQRKKELAAIRRRKKRSPRLDDSPPEWGDARDVRRIFGIKTSMLYKMIKTKRVKSVLITSPETSSGIRGKRLFDFASIRKMLKSLP